MEIRDIGVVSPGDMGQALAIRLAESGFRVHGALDGRSARTRRLAADAGMDDLGSLDALVAGCDLVLSVISPAGAVALAGELAAALRRTRRRIVVADLNAVSPEHAREAAELVTAAGGRFVDGGVLGAPPRGEARVRIVASGPEAALLESIAGPGIGVRVLSGRVGDASALKLCNAALTKGVLAVVLELLVAGRRLGIEDPLLAELRAGKGDLLESQLRSLPGMPSKSERWVPEMREIAAMFADVGLTPAIFEGAADLWGAVAALPMAAESAEAARAAGRSGLDVVRLVADRD